VIPEFRRFNIFDMTLLMTTKKTGYYKDTPVMLMEILNAFEIMDKQYKVERIKGIGEMTEEHLEKTCLNPATRTCIEVTGVGDIARLHALMGVDTKSRKELLSGSVG
jgi:DNA gyrase/topoisomerase IV subunit B